MNKFKKIHEKLSEEDVLWKLEECHISSSQEYELIINNLQQQNIKLFNDHQHLLMRVNILREKQDQMMEGEDSFHDTKTDFDRLKRELDRKYKEFEKWQNKNFKSDDQSTIGWKNYFNQLKQIQSKKEQLKHELADQKKAFKKLQKSIKEQEKLSNKNQPQRETIQEENKDLRKMIWNMKLVADLRSHVEVRIQDQFIGKKIKQKQRLKTTTIQQIKRQELPSKSKILVKQKEKVSKTMTQISPDQEGKKKKKQKLSEVTQSLKHQLLELKAKRDKISHEKTQLNKLFLQQQFMDEVQVYDIPIKPIQKCNAYLQANMYEDEQPLRRQILGTETNLIVDDRYLLKANKYAFIIGFNYYESRHGLGYVRAIYSNGKQTEEYRPLLKHKKIILKSNDHIKWIKGYYCKKRNQVRRIECYSHNKEKYEMGERREELGMEVMGYKFDILNHEMPVSMVCSYRAEDGELILCSFGVQINH